MARGYSGALLCRDDLALVRRAQLRAPLWRLHPPFVRCRYRSTDLWRGWRGVAARRQIVAEWSQGPQRNNPMSLARVEFVSARANFQHRDGELLDAILAHRPRDGRPRLVALLRRTKSRIAMP